jgi:outer membrane protein OmpA-like peptidoglycan-associated protein
MKKNIFVSAAITAAIAVFIAGYPQTSFAQYYNYNDDQPQVEVDMSVLDGYGAARSAAPRGYDKRTYPLVPPVGAVVQESLMSEPPVLDANPVPPAQAPESPTSPPSDIARQLLTAPAVDAPLPLTVQELPVEPVFAPQEEPTPPAPRRILKPTASPDAPLPAIEQPPAPVATPFKKMQPIISYPPAASPVTEKPTVQPTLPQHKPAFKKTEIADTPMADDMPPVVTEEPEIEITMPQQKPQPPQETPKAADIEWDEPVDVAAPVATSKPLLKPKPEVTETPVAEIIPVDKALKEEPVAESAAIDEPITPLSFGAVPTATDLSIDFAGESVDLDSVAEGKLKNVIQQMNAADNMLQVRAYATGQDGSKSSARRISLSRALAVRSYLMDNGIKPHRVNVRALGSETDRSPVDRVDLIFAR